MFFGFITVLIALIVMLITKESSNAQRPHNLDQWENKTSLSDDVDDLMNNPMNSHMPYNIHNNDHLGHHYIITDPFYESMKGNIYHTDSDDSNSYDDYSCGIESSFDDSSSFDNNW